jgi:hypothetical protein
MSNNCHDESNFNAKMFFTSKHKRFIIESYFGNGVFNNGEWTYSAVAYLAEFRQNFPNLN